MTPSPGKEARNRRDRILLVSSSHHQQGGTVARCERYWTSGLTLVYLFFQIPLMILIITPAILDTLP